ncbi:hypothetical protein MKEN_00126600 [Mycena kentingensis (nom. inval.)]|nr:hypothetical protein MKEN_00126600 [Mycena kentingensis (nom. inval.)]
MLPSTNDASDASQNLTKLGSRLSSAARDATNRSPIRAMQLPQRIEPLNSLALIAIFFAGVQAQTISASLNQTDTALNVVTNCLAFAGLFFDVLGGNWAIVGSIQLQSTHALLSERKTAISELREALKKVQSDSRQLALLNHLHILDKTILAPIYHPQLWKELCETFQQSTEGMERVLRTMDDAVQISAAYSIADYRDATRALKRYASQTSLGIAASIAVPSIVIAGLACFAAGASCLAVSSQPTAVWATSFGVVAATILLFSIVFVATHSGYTLHRSYPRKREWD